MGENRREHDFQSPKKIPIHLLKLKIEPLEKTPPHGEGGRKSTTSKTPPGPLEKTKTHFRPLEIDDPPPPIARLLLEPRLGLRVHEHELRGIRVPARGRDALRQHPPYAPRHRDVHGVPDGAAQPQRDDGVPGAAARSAGGVGEVDRTHGALEAGRAGGAGDEREDGGGEVEEGEGCGEADGHERLVGAGEDVQVARGDGVEEGEGGQDDGLQDAGAGLGR